MLVPDRNREDVEHAKMCKLARSKKLHKIQKLSQHPRYVCRKCGQVADCENNLCKPAEFDV